MIRERVFLWDHLSIDPVIRVLIVEDQLERLPDS